MKEIDMDRRHIPVNVNGDEVFWVDKNLLCSFVKLSKLLHQSPNTPTFDAPKVTLMGLPGGPPVFELIARLYYGHDRIAITPASVCLVACATHFMEIAEGTSWSTNLGKEIKSCLESIPSWRCSEMLAALKHCHDNLAMATSSGVFDKVLDALMTRISSETAAISPPDCSGFRFSADGQSMTSSKSTFSGSLRVWWLDDLVAFGADSIQKIAKSMMSHNLDHALISRFLFYYLKSKCSTGTPDERRAVMEQVVDVVYSLDRASVSCKCLFEILRMSSSLSLRTCTKRRLEIMIGCHMDQATLDSILVQASSGVGSLLYDVDLVLRLLKYFLDNGGFLRLPQLKKVGSLMDLYLVEIAPDPGLRPHKFILLAMALPDRARDCHDGIYQAIDIYLQVHSDLSEQEKMKICCVLNYEKISSKACEHLTQNSNMPSRTAVQAVLSQQSKLRALLQDTNFNNVPRNSISDEGEQVVLYAKKLDVSTENKMLRDHLQGMQWRIVELENVCKKMQSHISRTVKTEMPSKRPWWPLPRLCS